MGFYFQSKSFSLSGIKEHACLLCRHHPGAMQFLWKSLCVHSWRNCCQNNQRGIAALCYFTPAASECRRNWLRTHEAGGTGSGGGRAEGDHWRSSAASQRRLHGHGDELDSCPVALHSGFCLPSSVGLWKTLFLLGSPSSTCTAGLKSSAFTKPAYEKFVTCGSGSWGQTVHFLLMASTWVWNSKRCQ